MIPEFKLKMTTTKNIALNIKVQLEGTKNQAMMHVQDKNVNGRFVKSITLSLLGLHQVIKVSMLINKKVHVNIQTCQ